MPFTFFRLLNQETKDFEEDEEVCNIPRDEALNTRILRYYFYTTVKP